MAVGTDLVWGTLTKAVGSFVHCRQKTVDFTIVRRLAMGSIPGAITGLALLARLHRHHGTRAMDQVVVRMLAIALMCVALSLFIRTIRGPRIKAEGDVFDQNNRGWVTSAVGAVIGFLVSLTSVGSGSLIVACLVILYPRTSMRRIVGSDIVHALFLVGVSALGHLGLGSVDVSLLGVLLVGSIPGVWLGSKMSAVIPERVLQPLLATTLFVLGFKLM
ncbi:MAG: sulfite exporter TauE/SafE family protein [Candidatus Acidiferrales bacterium]